LKNTKKKGREKNENKQEAAASIYLLLFVFSPFN